MFVFSTNEEAREFITRLVRHIIINKEMLDYFFFSNHRKTLIGSMPHPNLRALDKGEVFNRRFRQVRKSEQEKLLEYALTDLNLIKEVYRPDGNRTIEAISFLWKKQIRGDSYLDDEKEGLCFNLAVRRHSKD